MMPIKISSDQYVKRPTVPNYLVSVNRDGPSISIADVSEEQLQMIGEDWTRALIRKAELRRKWRKGGELLKPCS